MYSKFRAIQGKCIYEMVNRGDDFSCLLYSCENKWVLECLRNQELYAPSFEELNDINEGFYQFSYAPSTDNIDQVNKILEHIKNSKNKYRICSFSKTPRKFKDDTEQGLGQQLMWAHYANGHKGIRIDFEIKDKEIKEYKVDYTNNKDDYRFLQNICDLHFNQNEEYELIKQIFTTKQKIWEYEKEHRAITTDDKVKIKIEQIVIGRGFLKTTFNYGRNGNRFDDNLINFAMKLKSIVSQDIKIFAYESKYSNKLIEIKEI